jgi:hypothetical protein
MRCLFVGFLAFFLAASAHALEGSARAGVDLQGRWAVDAEASDDAEAILARRLEEQMKRAQRMEERRRREMERNPYAWEPEFTPPERTPQSIAAMEERRRAVRQMLGMTKFLEIEQSLGGARLTIRSDFETRRLDAGSRSQVSLPQGQLADARYGWDGEWFVIERKARGGPRITERFRRLAKTDQLEMQVAIKGDSPLAGIKLRRIFNRATSSPNKTPAEVMGPVR